MKCHTCGEDLIQDSDDPFKRKRWACPSMHVLNVELDSEGTVVAYMIFWDDVERDGRYRLESDRSGTNMRHRPLKQREVILPLQRDKNGYLINENPRWKTMMEFSNFMPLTVKDDRIVIDNLIHRLLKLKAFA
jgi:hypothetical protein